MDKKVDCRDLGLECSLTVCAQNEEDLVKQMEEHARSVHGMKGFSKEFYEKLRASTYDGSCESEEELCDMCCC